MSSFVTPRQSPSSAGWTHTSTASNNLASSIDNLPTSNPTSTRTSFDNSSITQPMQNFYNTPNSLSTARTRHESGLQKPRGTRLYADTLQPPQTVDELTSPTFSIDDWLTPEASSDYQGSGQSSHATPAAEQQSWQDSETKIHSIENFDPLAFSDTGNEDFLLSDSLDALGQDFIGKGNMSHQHFLLTPDPTSTSGTPDRSFAQPSTQTSSTNQHGGLQVTPQSMKRSREDTELAPYANDDQLHTQGYQSHGQRSIQQAVSPSVLITSHSRGDSPARSQVPLVRSSSKRSQSSRLGEHVESQTLDSEIKSNTSRLMPPNDMGDDEWDDDDQERAGLAPGQRDAEFVPSLKDLDQQREQDKTRTEVENWLAKSEAGTPTGEEPPQIPTRSRSRKNRIRSRSTDTRYDAMGLQVFDDSHIPGPGCLIDEVSNYHYSDDGSDLGSTSGEGEATGSESPPAKVDTVEEGSYFPPVEEDLAPDELEPLPNQFYRMTPWQDQVRVLDSRTERGQPHTSNAAMMYYDKQAAKFETASRAATWGTGRRRLSDSEIAPVTDGTLMSRHLSIKDSFTNKALARGTHFINSVKNSMPRRTSSFIKKRQQSRNHSPEEKIEQVASPEAEDHRASISSSRPLHRMSTSSKRAPKSPPLNTGSAIMAMTGHLAAIGGSSAGVSHEPEVHHNNSLFSALKRARSKSDIPKTPKPNSGPSEYFPNNIEQEMIASPGPVRDLGVRGPSAHDDDMDDVNDDDDEKGIKMEMPMELINIIPTLEGFKTHARQLNPRMAPFLIERIATDQLRRYKKLVKNRVDHTQNVQLKGHCSSGKHCVDLGGKATILPPRSGSKDSNANFAQFKVAAGGDSEGDEAAFADGVVTPALFPPGIPQPPTTHLPAEFECPLCFQVKKFQKPSDWTKHVHEDVQPFSCTFPNCTEPKSFKRKADWVRHENERHRHLEWWTCSMQDCKHTCYRKDNFVQHLVREHKMIEPKGKAQKATISRANSTSRTAGPSGQSADDFWHIVESCRHETEGDPRNEPCKFCNNKCSTWKKLSVHVGKHMEQIAMPVLELARSKTVTVDTVVSPVEAPRNRTYGPTLETANLNNNSQYLRSPYTASVNSPYQGSSSAGHSPVPMHNTSRGITPTVNQSINQAFYQQNMAQVPMQQMPPISGPPNMNRHMDAADYRFPGYDNYNNHSYMSVQQPGVYNTPAMGPGPGAPYHPSQVPRSQPMEGYNPMAIDPLQGPMFGQQQFYTGAVSDNSYPANYVQAAQPGPSSHTHTPISSGPGGDDSLYYATHRSGGY